MQFFDRLILREDISDPNKPPIIKNNNLTKIKQSSTSPPDFTKNQQPKSPENNQEIPGQPQNQNILNNKKEFNGKEEKEKEPLDISTDTENSEGENEDIYQGEEIDNENSSEENQDDIFSDLKPEQMNIKTIELKNQFKNINSVITASIDKINKISRNTYDDTLVEFIIRKLLQLRDYSKDYIIKTFKTKSYIENQIEFQRMMITFNLISNLFNNIKISRMERREIVEKKNNHLFKVKKNNLRAHSVFSRGF